ncbi:F-box/LRR-repeat protein [Spatholobus suberectus]|nr:F-box/LRR-repeat protein [Spatholobus suberectus]
MRFTCEFEEYHADAMIKYTPNLKLLSIRSTLVSMKGLCRVPTFLEHLEVLNICHSLIMDKSNPRPQVVVYRIIHDLRKHLPPSCLGKLIFCQGGSCLRCKNGCGPIEDIWHHEDEIVSLAH